MASDRDQRQHPRVDASFRVRSTALDPSALAGENVSRGGIFVKTVRFLPLNAVIRLSIEVPGTEIAVPATCRVVFIRDAARARTSGKPSGMGLELLDISDHHRVVLERLLAEQGAEAAPTPQAGPEGPLRVVVADDDARYREMAAEPFRKRGDTVHTANDGLEALSVCLKDPPDIILSDVQMPRMDGWQLLRLVRARPSLSSVPVVFLTTLDGEAERLPSPAPRSTLRGEIAHVGLQSLFTFLEMERKSGVLLIIGNEVARVVFSAGRLLRAEIEGETPPLPSRKAAMRVLDTTSGQFEFSPQDVTAKDEVGTSVTALLLEHAQLTDERAR